MTILDQSLCLLQGVSAQAEIRLHKMGVLTCKQLAEDADRYFSAAHAERIRDSYGEWLVASKRGLVDWIVTHLPLGHRVRVLKQFRNDACFMISKRTVLQHLPVLHVYQLSAPGISARFGEDTTCVISWMNGQMQRYW